MRKFWCLVLAALPNATAATATHAIYDLYYRGMHAGEVAVTVSHETARTYYEAVATPNLIADILGQGVITERGVAERDSLRPLEYFYHDAGREQHYKYVYNWASRRVFIATHEREATHKLSDGTLDPAAMALVLIRDTPRLAPNYSVLSRGQLKVYRFDAPDVERIEVLGEPRPVWKVVRERGDAKGTRIITWHDGALGGWMVRTVRMEGDTEKVRLELSGFR